MNDRETVLVKNIAILSKEIEKLKLEKELAELREGIFMDAIVPRIPEQHTDPFSDELYDTPRRVQRCPEPYFDCNADKWIYPRRGGFISRAGRW